MALRFSENEVIKMIDLRVMSIQRHRTFMVAISSLGLIVFFLAWYSFNYPLSYCDSPFWGSHLVNFLDGQSPSGIRMEAWIVRLYFGALGWLTVQTGFFNLIGAIQAGLLFWSALRLINNSSFGEKYLGLGSIPGHYLFFDSARSLLTNNL
jgi:hypothetical protein